MALEVCGKTSTRRGTSGAPSPRSASIFIASVEIVLHYATKAWRKFLTFRPCATCARIIQCCFGVDRGGGHPEMKEWVKALPADERDRRHDFKKAFEPHYDGFRALPLGAARHISEHRTGVAPATVTISGMVWGDIHRQCC